MSDENNNEDKMIKKKKFMEKSRKRDKELRKTEDGLVIDHLKYNATSEEHDQSGILIKLDDNISLVSEEFEFIKDLEDKWDIKLNYQDRIGIISSGIWIENHHVIELYLINRKLKNIPDSIGNLSFLKILDIHSSPIESLPETIGKLYNLREIIISLEIIIAILLLFQYSHIALY